MKKEEFDKLFPKGGEKEKLRRFLANQMLIMHKYSIQQTYEFVYSQIP